MVIAHHTPHLVFIIADGRGWLTCTRAAQWRLVFKEGGRVGTFLSFAHMPPPPSCRRCLSPTAYVCVPSLALPSYVTYIVLSLHQWSLCLQFTLSLQKAWREQYASMMWSQGGDNPTSAARN
jgi:hypothetical protein